MQITLHPDGKTHIIRCDGVSIMVGPNMMRSPTALAHLLRERVGYVPSDLHHQLRALAGIGVADTSTGASIR